MKLAISNIAWSQAEEPAIARRLRELGVDHIELAPTARWPDLTVPTAEDLAAYRQWWEDQGFTVAATQSILFGRPDLVMFADEATRRRTLDFLKLTIRVSAALGAKVIVFGSPKNRQRGQLSSAAAHDIAVPFFQEIGRAANAAGVNFCVEPNAPQYACDYVTTAAEGAKLVAAVNTPGFGLHLDAACMAMAGDGPELLNQYRPRHFHISAPMLEAVPADTVPYADFASALKGITYGDVVSIEMRPAAEGNLERAERAVTFAQRVFSA